MIIFLLFMVGVGLVAALVIFYLCRKEEKASAKLETELEAQLRAQILARIQSKVEAKLSSEMERNCLNQKNAEDDQKAPDGQAFALAHNSGIDYCTKGFNIDVEQLESGTFDLSCLTVSGKES
ncbi:MAG: hypothetical protein LIO95_03360 [Clostridiales bacterium]|nr:hypothetical protein [Clostridiales bacterium]